VESPSQNEGFLSPSQLLLEATNFGEPWIVGRDLDLSDYATTQSLPFMVREEQ
jgi:hypothetical protein